MNEMPQGHVVLEGWNPEVERREREAVEASRLRENRRVEAEKRRQQAEVEAAKQQRRVAEQQERERRLQRRVEAMWFVVKVVVFIPIGLFKVVVVILLALVVVAAVGAVAGTMIGVVVGGWPQMGILALPLAVLLATAVSCVVSLPCCLATGGLLWLMGLRQ